MKDWRKFGGIIGIVGCFQFLIFSTLAMFNYSGGTSWNKSAEGYTFWHNVMSDLGRTVSYSGLSNTVSSRLFNFSLISFGFSIIIIYLSIGKRFLQAGKLIFYVRIIGIISGLGIMGVGLTPDDILSDEHIIAVWIWILSLSMVLIMIVLSKLSTHSKDNILSLSIILFILVCTHISQGLLGMWSPAVVAIQKIVIYLNVLWYLLISKNIIDNSLDNEESRLD